MYDGIPVPAFAIIAWCPSDLTADGRFTSTIWAVTENSGPSSQTLENEGLGQVFELACTESREVVVHEGMMPYFMKAQLLVRFTISCSVHRIAQRRENHSRMGVAGARDMFDLKVLRRSLVAGMSARQDAETSLPCSGQQ